MDLLFKNPTFHDGLNWTCRKGSKWFDVDCPPEGFPVIDTNHSDKVLGFAHSEYRTFSKFREIKNSDFSKQHDPNCRNYDDLLKEMQKLYPGFTEEYEVTIIFFEFVPVSENPKKEE